MKRFLFGLALLAAPLAAHEYVLEPVQGLMQIRHVDYNPDYRSEKIEKWENYATLKAALAGTGARLDLARADGHFTLPWTDPKAGLLLWNTERGVVDWRKYDEGIVRPFAYARYLPSLERGLGKPELELDALPVPGKAGRFTVFYKGKPLAKAKVKVYAPNFWIRETESDGKGRFGVELPWEGNYVVVVDHKFKTPEGSHHGAPYEWEVHRLSLSFGLPER